MRVVADMSKSSPTAVTIFRARTSDTRCVTVDSILLFEPAARLACARDKAKHSLREYGFVPYRRVHLAANNTDLPRSNNTLLASLPKPDYDRVEPYLRRITVVFKEVLHEQGEPIHRVFFPGGAVCSLLRKMADGAVAEIAIVGREGAVGTSVFGGSDQSMNETLVQVTEGDGGGYGYAMSVQAFNDEMNEGGAFCQAVIRFSHALMWQIAQNAVCNAFHNHDQRGCRWLLMTQDRTGTDAFQLTDDLFGAMLGIRRPAVMLVTDGLQKRRLVHFHDGTLTVLDRPGLEQAACECYRHIKTAYEGLLSSFSTDRN